MTAPSNPQIAFGMACLSEALRAKCDGPCRREAAALAAKAQALVADDPRALAAVQRFVAAVFEGAPGAAEDLYLFALRYAERFPRGRSTCAAQGLLPLPDWTARKDCGHD